MEYGQPPEVDARILADIWMAKPPLRPADSALSSCLCDLEQVRDFLRRAEDYTGRQATSTACAMWAQNHSQCRRALHSIDRPIEEIR